MNREGRQEREEKRFGLAFGQKILLFQPVNHSVDAVFHQCHIPVEQKAKLQAGKFEVGQQLRLVYGNEPFHSLVFDDHHSIYNYVCSEPGIDLDLRVPNRHDDFALDRRTGPLQFIGQALLIGRFQEPRAKAAMDLDGAVNDPAGNCFDFHLSLARQGQSPFLGDLRGLERSGR